MSAARPAIWGIVNVTPDSFSDAGSFFDHRAAIDHGIELARCGADVLDVGGESTRPGADPVSEAEEIRRVGPVLTGLARAGVEARLSVDTRHVGVAAAALDAGATIVNDVSAAAANGMLELVAERGAGLVLMHMQGTPRSMQEDPSYEEVVADVTAYLVGRAEAALVAGIAREDIWLDPGIGFGKTLAHNVELLRRLEHFVALDHPILLGASRKSFIGQLTGRQDPAERLAGSLVCVLRAMQAGVQAVRVHDVKETHDVLEVWAQIR